MLNHKVKLEVEEYLIESGLDWTILQPTHVMQQMPLDPIISSGVMTLPYSPATVQGFIDLADFAQVVLKVARAPKEHNMARYELLGCIGSYNEVADIIASKIGKSVKIERIPAEQAAARAGTHPYTQEAMRRMYYYYDTRGLTGSPNVLRWLLGRDPSTWDSYLDRSFKK
ncbi:NAD(P)-binding protein [Calocera cornea HHB12733]|uniref:NAD(P)-binding protein n=1 Tax=Calocera cornea HHB12733 TaxID=1353952 RepID=A0A165IWK4_9BASI|nr:NAD(P)-binding protein [Calocera cornea HHB12733]